MQVGGKKETQLLFLNDYLWLLVKRTIRNPQTHNPTNWSQGNKFERARITM